MFFYIYWRLGGETNREIDFGFGFVSCVTWVRAGEAKLRGSASAAISSYG